MVKWCDSCGWDLRGGAESNPARGKSPAERMNEASVVGRSQKLKKERREQHRSEDMCVWQTQENARRLIRKLGNDLDFMKRVYTERRNEYHWWEDTLCVHFQDTAVRLPVKGGQWTRVPTHTHNYNQHSREEAWRDTQHRQVCKLLESCICT